MRGSGFATRASADMTTTSTNGASAVSRHSSGVYGPALLTSASRTPAARSAASVGWLSFLGTRVRR